MTAHPSKEYNRSVGLPILSILFRLVFLVVREYNVHQFSFSQKCDRKKIYELLKSGIFKAKLRLLQTMNTGYSRLQLQNTSYHRKLSKTLLMTLPLFFCQTPVHGDVTVSTTQGTYFQNEGLERYLQGYVSESFAVSTLFECQVKCDTLHSICRSLNYIENKDRTNNCEINNEAQYCVLPGDFIVKKNSVYIETILKNENAWCSICGYRGLIKKTESMPGYTCLCQEGFYGNKCQHQDLDECSMANNPCHSNATCNITLGSFLCSCKAGFEGDGLNCTDVDECSMLNNSCHSNATCNNTLGSFLCSCKAGFNGDGLNCTADILSNILHDKPEYQAQLKLWLPEYNIWNVCYRATKHGWDAATFHSRCDHKIPTVAVVRVGQYTFGGFSDLSWTGTVGYVRSLNAFLFSLKNKDNIQPFKAVVNGNNNQTIFRNSGCGPTFGGGHDLYIASNANLNNHSFTHFGHSYQPPVGYTLGAAKTKALLAGTYHFTPSEVEVFYLQ